MFSQFSSVVQLCPTLCDTTNGSPQAALSTGIQARILEWVAMPFSRGSSWPRYTAQISCIAGRFFTIWATREAQQIGVVQFRDFALTWPPDRVKVTYIRRQGPSNKRRRFLSSRGTACRMPFKVFSACWELGKVFRGRDKDSTRHKLLHGAQGHWCQQLTSRWIKGFTASSVTRNPKVNMKEFNSWIFPESRIFKESHWC